jgi:hypothetical protein
VPDLHFKVLGVEPERFAATPQLLFRLHVADVAAPTVPIHAVVLRCQARIEPGRRRYGPPEEEKLLELFGPRERWGQTLRGLLWAHLSAVVPAFEGETTVDLPVPCSFDFNVASTKYLDALEGGEVPVCFLFSGTVFHEGPDGALQVAPISWEREATFRLPVATWRSLMDRYYPDSAWLCLRKGSFDRLARFKAQHGLPTWERAIEELLAPTEEGVPS